VTKLSMHRVEYDQAPSLDAYGDHTVFQTNNWLNFVARAQDAEPVIAAIMDGPRPVGRFAGLIIKRYGLRILGSPAPGWTTAYMGFNLDPAYSRADALVALEEFAFRDLQCVHVEIMDRRIEASQLEQAGYTYRLGTGFEIDLTKSEDELFAAMTSACRRCIRKAEKVGVQVEQATDASFADDFYAQIQDVFAKQDLVPTYPKERVEILIDELLPTGNLLLVRARNSEGVCIGTGIFPALNDMMYFWGGASWRPYQILRPNEAVQWFAMRYWKARGISIYRMGGGGEYKRKYGGRDITAPWGRKSKYPILEHLRNSAQTVQGIKQRVAFRIRGGGGEVEDEEEGEEATS
jgi:hypothetical protein